MWTTEWLTREKLEKAAELARSYYGEDDDTASVEYLEHEYFVNPPGEALVRIGWNPEKGEITGQFAMVPVWIKADGEQRKCLMGANSLTRAEYRGQGLFKALVIETMDQAAADGFGLAYGMPNQNAYPAETKYGKFVDGGRIPLYVRPLNVSHMVRSFLHSRLLAALARPFNIFFQIGKAKMQEGMEIVELTHENLSLADAFWKNVCSKYPVMLVRDKTRMEYRFLNMPRRDYICLYAVREGIPVAYAVGRIMEVSGIQCGMIADYLFIQKHEKEAACLLRKLLEQLKAEGADMAGCMVPASSEEAALLKKAGFLKCPRFLEPQPFLFIYKPLDEEFDQKHHLGEFEKRWFFTMGDYDIV